MSALETRYPDPQRSPGFLLWHVTQAWQRHLRTVLRPFELTHVQFVLLTSLVSIQPDSATQRQLAARANTDVMMTSQVVRTLERKGLIERIGHPNDKRAILLSPTPAGVRSANAAVQAVEAADAAFFATLPSERLGGLVSVLQELKG